MMKDKLVKFHHKGGYYRTRKFFLAAVLLASISTAVAVPTYVGVSARAESPSSSEVSEERDESQYEINTSEDTTLHY